MNTTISPYDPVIDRAVRWLKEQYQLPMYGSVITEFENEFNCKIIMNSWLSVDCVDFQTSENLMMFLLKWS